MTFERFVPSVFNNSCDWFLNSFHATATTMKVHRLTLTLSRVDFATESL